MKLKIKQIKYIKLDFEVKYNVANMTTSDESVIDGKCK